MSTSGPPVKKKSYMGQHQIKKKKGYILVPVSCHALADLEDFWCIPVRHILMFTFLPKKVFN